MSKIKTILSVCTGNSCRSVMAAGLLEDLLKGKGDYKIINAGTAAIKGMPATSEAIQVMSEQNIDVSGHRSSPLSDEMIKQADLILVMERRHKENILSRSPQAKDKVVLLSELGDIPDPIGKSIEFYRKVLGMIKEGVLRIVKELEGR
jgi:protein-tyrosine-phosphatase